MRGFTPLVLVGIFLVGSFSVRGQSKDVIRLDEGSWKKMPYRLEISRKNLIDAQRVWTIVDRDEDGKSELLNYPAYTYYHPPKNVHCLEFFDFGFHSLGRLNLLGKVYINGVLVADAKPQSGKELIISAGKKNRIWLFLFNPEDSLACKLPLYTHTAEDTSWKGKIVPVGLYDVNGDGRRDLISFMTTTFWLYPRGVLVTDLEDGSTIWRFDTGCFIGSDYYIVDFDGDGRKELIFSGDAPANGAYANGTDDYHSYLIVLDLRTGQRRLIKEVGEAFSSVSLLEVVPQQGKIYFVFSHHGQEPNLSFIACLSYPDASLTNKKYLHSIIEGARAWDFDGDGSKEFVIARADKRDILIFDANLNLLRQQRFQYTSSGGLRLVDIADVNHDFKPEIIAILDDRVTFLNSDLKPIAQFPEVNCRYVGLFHTQADEPPLVLIRQNIDRSTSSLYFLTPHRHFVWPLPISWQATLGFAAGLLLFGTVLWVRRSLVQKGVTIRSLQRSLQLAPYGIMLLNANGKITFCNETLRKQLRLQDYILEGRNFRKVLTDEKFQPLRQLLEDSYNEQLTQFRRTLNLSGSEGAAGEIRVSVTHIYDDRRKERGRLVILHEPVQETGTWRKQEWLKLARHIAHEIRNPLSTIILTLQRLQMEYSRKDPEHAADYNYFTERIMGRVEYLESLTLRFLKLLRLEDLNLQSCDINELLQECFEEFTPGLPKDVELHTCFGSGLPLIKADPDQIKSLVENLLTNAVNAMPRGGVLTVTTSVERNLHPPVDDASVGDYILLRIRDTGCGMSQEVKDRLFQPYFSGDGEGVGLGLTIVKRIVDEHHGFIQVESEEGVGTTFDVYLPVSH